MYTVFSEGFFTSDKQIFYVIKFLSAMTSQLHIFFKKSGGWVRNVFEGTIQSAA